MAVLGEQVTLSLVVALQGSREKQLVYLLSPLQHSLGL